jgi:hypothetical protein
MQTCTNECKDSWCKRCPAPAATSKAWLTHSRYRLAAKHGKECAGIQWNPLSKQCSLKGEASTAAKFNFDFNFSSSVFLIKNKDCQSNSLWGKHFASLETHVLAAPTDPNLVPRHAAPSKGNDCCCNYKA